MKHIVDAAVGRWRGTERMLAEPDQGEWKAATSSTETIARLDGALLESAYAQTVDGQPGTTCRTLIHFQPDGRVRVHWFPAVGLSRVFDGGAREGVLVVSRTDDDGVVHRLVWDYSKPGEMTNTMEVEAEAATLTVFEGRYERVGSTLGREVWRDLTVPDAERVETFYESVLGWGAQPVDMGEYDDFNMLDEDGEVVGGVCHARGANADLPAAWLLYFSVESVDDAVAAATARGGELVAGPKEFATCRYAVLRDPAGAVFAVVT